MALKYLWKTWVSTDAQKLPERDEKMLVCDAIMGEVDYYIKESEQIQREKEQEERRRKTGVDYSWLVSTAPKTYEIPQLERLELEELCCQVKAIETSKILSLFRDTLLNEPKPYEIPRIMRACITQILQQRPKEESISEWVTRRTGSLVSVKIRPSHKVTPVADVEDPDADRRISGSTCSFNSNATEESFTLRTISSPELDDDIV